MVHLRSKLLKACLLTCVCYALLSLCGCELKNHANSEVDKAQPLPIAASPNTLQTEIELEEPYYYPTKSKLTLCVDPRIELLNLAAEFMYDKPMNYAKDPGYVVASRKLFKPNVSDRFLLLLDNGLKKGMTYGAFTEVVSFFDRDNKVNKNLDFKGLSIKLYEYLDTGEMLMYLMRNFREKGEFEEFFNSNKPLYEILLKKSDQLISKNQIVENIENFFGQSIENTTVTITPYAQNGYNVTFPLKDGGYETLITIPVPIPDNDIEFTSIIIHELAHRFTTIGIKNHTDSVAKSEWRYKPFDSSASNEVYNNWDKVFDEYTVRAVTCLLIGEIHGEEEMKRQVTKNFNQGFSHIEDAIALIKVYHNSRDKYLTFQDYLPVFAEEFAKEN